MNICLKKYYIVCLLSMIYTFCFSQNNETELPEIDIKASRSLLFDVGNERTEIKDLEKLSAISLTEKLQNINSMSIRNYGVGSLSLFAIRGTKPSQNAILWNGVNLQSNMNGLADISLLSLPVFDEISVVSGGQSALYGSGAIGGVLNLNSKFEQKKPNFVKINLGIGSFGERFGVVSAGFQKGKSTFETRFFRYQATNDFTYRFGGQKFVQENANVLTQGNLSSYKYKFSPNTFLECHSWIQSANRALPPSLTQANDFANQQDFSARFNSDFTSIKNRFSTKTKFYLAYETIDYQSIVTKLEKSNGNRIVFEHDYLIPNLKKNQLFSLGLQYKYDWAKISNSNVFYHQNTLALRAAFRSDDKQKLKYSANLRYEYIEKTARPFTFQLGASYSKTEKQVFRASISKNYNAPTFNDLYWPQSGNLNLKAENGYTSSVSYFLQKPVQITLTHFQNYINNWIEWSPNKGSVWTPKNILAVWSRGFESSFSRQFMIKTDLETNVSIRYSYVKSTYEAGVDSNSLHKQLLFTPPHTASLVNNLIWKKRFMLQFEHNFTSKRFVVTDNLNTTPAYIVGNCFLSYEIKNMNFVLKINNIWNTPYQSIQYRPMPERRFSISMNLKI